MLYNSYMNDRGRETSTGLLPLLHAADAAHAYVESRLATRGLSLAKLGALTVLREAGESLPLGQLAERLSCVKSNITQLVDRLVADGLVSREPDPTDRRSRLAVMTAAGRKAWKDGLKLQQTAERELFDVLSAREAREFAVLVQKVTRRAG